MENNQIYEVEYLGGHPQWSKPLGIKLTVRKSRGEIFLQGRGLVSSNQMLFIKSDDIVSVDLEEKKNRSVGKAAAGAIIGGLLTGGIGLLAGGAIGASRKDNSVLYLTISYNSREFQVRFKTGKHTNVIYSEICGLFA